MDQEMNHLQNCVDDHDFIHMRTCLLNNYKNKLWQQKQTHIRKFKSLLDEKQRKQDTHNNLRNTNNFSIDKTVINLSNRHLSNTEKNILAKGLNFSVRQNYINKFQFIAAIEESAQQLHRNHPESSNEFRVRSKLILENKYNIKGNFTKEEKACIKNLKADATIKILPADKGNATVILDQDTYTNKLMALITEGPYKKLKKDPTQSIENKIYKTLFKFKNEFTDFERMKLTTHHSKPPHLYGLPKIHKPEIPLRPIISSIEAPCHLLSKYLLKIINPLAGNTDSFIKNSQHFIEKIRQTNINNNTLMVSFDVVSLFTNVPVDKTLTILKSKLENDRFLHNRTKLSVNTIMELITLCVTTTYFQLDKDFYEQTFGMPMGSSLSPFLSNIFMEFFEDNFVQTYTNKPLVWWRYVDDIFTLWPQNNNEHVNDFLNYINSQETSIKFTTEFENHNELPFLDVLVKKTENTIETCVYKKKTHTNRYLNFQSKHSNNVKKGIIKSLYDRAKIICSNENLFQNEIKFVKSVLAGNNYPESFINTTLNHISQTRPVTQQQQQQIEYTNMTIPYIPGLSDKLKRIANKYNIRTTFKTDNTLRSILTKTKPHNEDQNSKNCVYSISCECGTRYIGETGRPLHVRVREHQNYLKTGEYKKSKLSQHSWEEDHHIKWGEALKLTKEAKSFRRKIKEAALIMLSGDTCLSNCSVQCSPMWKSILKEELVNKHINIK